MGCTTSRKLKSFKGLKTGAFHKVSCNSSLGATAALPCPRSRVGQYTHLRKHSSWVSEGIRHLGPWEVSLTGQRGHSMKMSTWPNYGRKANVATDFEKKPKI